VPWHKLYTTMELVPVPLVPTCTAKWVYKAVQHLHVTVTRETLLNKIALTNNQPHRFISTLRNRLQNHPLNCVILPIFPLVFGKLPLIADASTTICTRPNSKPPLIADASTTICTRPNSRVAPLCPNLDRNLYPTLTANREPMTRTTHDALLYSALKRCARGLECTQYTVNLEHLNALSTQYTRSNGHLALSATHLTGTECSVRASCVVPCARESRRPPWASLSFSLSLTQALPRLDLPVSVLACDVRKPIETFGRELESVVPRLKTQKKNPIQTTEKPEGTGGAHRGHSGIHSDGQICRVGPAVSWPAAGRSSRRDPGSWLVVRRRADGFSHYH